ncbi:MAG: DoxX family protein [Actinomycetes bacterium]
MTSRLRRASPYLLAGLLVVTGSAHFVAPRPYAEIVPAQLPSPYALVYVSGVAELACAVGLVLPRTRRPSGWATALLFVAVFPANIRMAIDAEGRSDWYRLATFARLPLQLPLVMWAVSVARRAPASVSAGE